MQPRAMPRMSDDGSLVVIHSEKKVGQENRMIEVCRLPSGDVIHRIPSTYQGYSFQTFVDISPDNRWLATASKDAKL